MRTYVTHGTENRQWDCRFNIQDQAYLDNFLARIKDQCDKGVIRYVLVGGIEIGTKPQHTDYQREHVHVAVIFHNRKSKSSILKNWQINEDLGYYLVPRNRELPYKGWRDHHIKTFSKKDQNSLCLYEFGELPTDYVPKIAEKSELEKKRKLDDILLEMRDMLQEGQDEEAFTKFPRTYLQHGEKIKAMLQQRVKTTEKTYKDPHIWLYGWAGTGKTAILNFLYPDAYKKNLHNKFFDLYKPEVHTHVLLEDLDHEAVERLGINFIKTICDETGFSVDQKYKTPQPAKTTCLITSNFSIPQIICDGKGVQENRAAIMRRFYHVRIDCLYQLLGLKLIPKEDRQLLQSTNNQDTSKLFIAWDYLQNQPLYMPIRDAEYYRGLIRDYYFK